MAKVAVFSKYFGYSVGGAERSVVELMKDVEAQGKQIVALVNAHPKGFNASTQRMALPASWEVRHYELPVDLVRFRHVEYALNRPTLRRLAETLVGVDSLYAYGNLAPALLNAFRGESYYLVRDEYGLGWNRNYYTGVRRLAQALYHASEAPLRHIWQRDLRRAIARASLIANSRFIAQELRQIAPTRPISVIPSSVDVDALVREYEIAPEVPHERKGVVVIGDNVLKGGDIARQVAARLRNITFYLFDRKYPEPSVRGNVHFMPWLSPGAVFRHARVVMVPSRWSEAFPRAVLEAQILHIPVVASNRGGIAEAILDASMLVDEIDDADEWGRRILRAFDQNDIEPCVR